LNAKPDPTVSVLVTVYNREPYLAESVESILNSTFQDFEVIIVDDRSSDDSVAIARAFAARDSRCKVYENPENLGDYPNRMKAASLASGRYIKYLDSDDIIYPYSLAIMVEAMERYPNAALGLVHSVSQAEAPYPSLRTPEQAYREQFLGRGCLNCGPSGAIIRRGLFEKVGGYDPSWGVIADIELWFRMAMRWPIVLLPPGLAWWRRHQAQEFTLSDADLVYLACGYQLARKVLSHSVCPLSDDDRNRATQRARQHFSRRLWSLALRQGRPGAALRIFRQSGLTVTELAQGLRGYN